METNMAFDYSGLLELAGDNYKWSAYAGAAGAFAQMASAGMNYQALQTNAAALKAQANSVELQAQQKANMLREQFIGAVGAYQMNAAQRGVSVGSGSVRDNIEGSAMSLGKDIQTMKRNSQLQADAIRTQAKVAKFQSRSALVSGMLSGISQAFGAYSNYQMGSKLSGGK